VKSELHPYRLELLVGGLVEPDPDEGVVASTGLEGGFGGELSGKALPFPVNGAIDDHESKS
jgi:hypothetical protein